jgi:hypothetical protein
VRDDEGRVVGVHREQDVEVLGGMDLDREVGHLGGMTTAVEGSDAPSVAHLGPERIAERAPVVGVAAGVEREPIVEAGGRAHQITVGAEAIDGLFERSDLVAPCDGRLDGRDLASTGCVEHLRSDTSEGAPGVFGRTIAGGAARVREVLGVRATLRLALRRAGLGEQRSRDADAPQDRLVRAQRREDIVGGLARLGHHHIT